jgi:hypothetical protein
VVYKLSATPNIINLDNIQSGDKITFNVTEITGGSRKEIDISNSNYRIIA